MSLHRLKSLSSFWKGAILALSWLAGISLLHYELNVEKSGRARVLMGYMPVITNLAAPVVDAATREREVRFEAVKFASFAEMAESFRAGSLQVGFIIAPLAIEMYRQGTPLKVVYIGNRHESTLVAPKDSPARSLVDLVGKTVAVPIRYSGHLLAIRRILRHRGLRPDAVSTVEIQPPDMPAALASGGIDGYFVGEPFASTALFTGTGKRLLDVESVWPRFICNLMIVREDLLRERPRWVRMLVTASVRSGFWARGHPEEAVELVARYWNQSPDLVRYTFTHPPGRFRFDLYTPSVEELQEVAREMRLAGFFNEELDLRGMVEDRFAREVETGPVESLGDVLPR